MLQGVVVVVLTAAGVSGTPAEAEVPTRWMPAVGTSWQWQLDGRLNFGVDAAVYDIDGFEATAADVSKLHGLGRKAVCYIDVGAGESYRPDYKLIPTSVLGRTVDGWAQERWLDIRKIQLLQPMLDNRFNMCQSKGFDAIEPDLVDGYANPTGFPLTVADQIAYNNHLADMAHARGMSIALKNAPELVGQQVAVFDFAVVEECLQYRECAAYQPFIAAGKAVQHAEYRGVFPRQGLRASLRDRVQHDEEAARPGRLAPRVPVRVGPKDPTPRFEVPCRRSLASPTLWP